ncbi:MAG: hypothetical protein KC468_19810 [Myxococcales bacterium]|nr:hypothetical protein [Myxococcales bacterium]
MIALDTMPTAANAVSLVFGFNLGAPVENQVPNVGNLSRDFAARVEFGTGNANFAVECDVLVGSRVSVAGDSVEVMMLDYTIQAQDPSAAYWGLVNAAAASYLPGLHGYKTDRCLLPCQYAAAAGLADTLGNLQQCLVDLEGP